MGNFGVHKIYPVALTSGAKPSKVSAPILKDLEPLKQSVLNESMSRWNEVFRIESDTIYP